MQYDFSLHMILILSALHLALTNSLLFTETHRAFILVGCSDAMAHFQEEAKNITDTNCNAMRAFPFLLSIYALALAQFDREEKSEETVLDEMIHILILIKGNRAVHETTNPWIQSRGIEPWMKEEDIQAGPGDHQGDLDLDSIVKDLQSWVDASQDEVSIRDTNTRTVLALRKTLSIDLKLSLRPLVWPNLIEDDYLDLLRHRNPMAMVILAHYAVVLGQCSSRWWCANWGARVVSVIATTLPDRYAAAIAYPLQTLGLT
jgi:hypothetical protein